MSDSYGSLPAAQAALLGAQLFDNSPDCMKLLDADGRLLAMNRNGRLGMEIDDFSALQGQRWLSLFPDESREAVGIALEQRGAAAAGGPARSARPCAARPNGGTSSSPRSAAPTANWSRSRAR